MGYTIPVKVENFGKNQKKTKHSSLKVLCNLEISLEFSYIHFHGGKMKKILLLSLLTVFFVGCGASDESSSSSSDSTITISGQIAESSPLTGNSLREAKALSDYTFYCVAFNAAASSCSDQLSATGEFSCAGIPADTAFGCFVKDATSIVATLEFQGSGTGFSDDSTSSVALGSNASLGTVTLNTTTGKATASKSVIADKISNRNSAISVDDIHNTSWNLSCVDGPDQVMNAACDVFVAESPAVFFRLLKATKNSKAVYGIGVWASQTAFQGCGSIDMTSGMKAGIESQDGITFSQNATGVAFTADHGEGGTCPTETGDAPQGGNATDIDTYFALNKLQIDGNTFSLLESETFENGSCSNHHKLSVTFSPSSATVMYGAFDMVDKYEGDCEGEEDMAAKFTVKFTKQ